jgi:hypothetical protein
VLTLSPCTPKAASPTAGSTARVTAAKACVGVSATDLLIHDGWIKCFTRLRRFETESLLFVYGISSRSMKWN